MILKKITRVVLCLLASCVQNHVEGLKKKVGHGECVSNMCPCVFGTCSCRQCVRNGDTSIWGCVSASHVFGNKCFLCS